MARREAGGTVLGLNVAQLRESMIASGRVSAADVDGAIGLCADWDLGFPSRVTMATWRCRPVAA
ncbi:MAG: hypothetical protein ICV69_11220 [Thermoleophilaceae bacterium]|nr:hypothetical protein [Thermoleophilaceae bacterium]